MNVAFGSCAEAIEYTNKTKSFAVFHSTKNDTDFTIHVHECCEVFLCISGGRTFLIDNKVYEVENGDMFVINQYEAHKITFDGNKPFPRYVIKIHPAFLYSCSTDETDLSACFYKRSLGSSNKITLSARELSEMKRLVADLTSQNEYADDVIKNIAMIKALVFINQLFMRADQTKGTKYAGNNVVQETIAYINNNYGGDLSLKTLAKNVYISENQLCRLFKKDLGITVSKYIASKRISHAKRLLKAGESVSATSLKCGYKDYTSFIRAFRKIVGVPPGKYLNY